MADAVAEAAAADPGPDDAAAPDDPAAEPASSRWRFGTRKLLVVDGVVEFRDDSPPWAGLRIVAEKVLAELTQKDDGFDAGLVVDAVRREGGPPEPPDAGPASLGPLSVAGRLSGTTDLTQLAGAKLTANVDLAGKVRARLDSPSLASRAGKVEADADVDFAMVMPLVPPILPALRRLIDLAPKGRVQVQLRGSYDPDKGLQLPELLVRATDVSADLLGGVHPTAPSGR